VGGWLGGGVVVGIAGDRLGTGGGLDIDGVAVGLSVEVSGTQSPSPAGAGTCMTGSG
jgi:hypothetical protein